jgi:hypothetical protein
MLYASRIRKRITIKVADGDYPNQELAKVLKKMGVKVKEQVDTR